MRNTPFVLKKAEAEIPAAMSDDDWARAQLAGTRMLIAEETLDAMVEILIDAGTLSVGHAAVMYDRLSNRLLCHATGRTETQWAIREPELIDQATRLASRAALLRGGVRRSRS